MADKAAAMTQAHHRAVPVVAVRRAARQAVRRAAPLARARKVAAPLVVDRKAVDPRTADPRAVARAAVQRVAAKALAARRLDFRCRAAGFPAYRLLALAVLRAVAVENQAAARRMVPRERRGGHRTKVFSGDPVVAAAPQDRQAVNRVVKAVKQVAPRVVLLDQWAAARKVAWEAAVRRGRWAAGAILAAVCPVAPAKQAERVMPLEVPAVFPVPAPATVAVVDRVVQAR